MARTETPRLALEVKPSLASLASRLQLPVAEAIPRANRTDQALRSLHSNKIPILPFTFTIGSRLRHRPVAAPTGLPLHLVRPRINASADPFNRESLTICLRSLLFSRVSTAKA